MWEKKANSPQLSILDICASKPFRCVNLPNAIVIFPVSTFSLEKNMRLRKIKYHLYIRYIFHFVSQLLLFQNLDLLTLLQVWKRETVFVHWHSLSECLLCTFVLLIWAMKIYHWILTKTGCKWQKRVCYFMRS